ncbi:unannotated protein [freshwater metagenome]|uniref:Nicotinamide nucleotide repair protein n=1 Tax=freshwater metagenome TaxID=449393 RepID=A0A6J7ED39_9ZZZZ
MEQQGVPSLELMERAAGALALLVQEIAPNGRIAVVCGAGNNGGDGYAAARLLRSAWREVDVLWTRDPRELTGDAAVQAQALPGAAPRRFEAQHLAGCTLVVDALLGIGCAGEPRGEVAAAITAIGAAGVPVVACDIPSGVDAASGEVARIAVRARATVTFHAPKPGLLINPGKAHAGELRVADIGIPAGVPSARIGLIEDAPLLGTLSSRAAHWTKFTSGRVLVAGGSPGLLGAVVLAAEAAMRAGAGYVTVCLPASQQPAAAAQLVEAMQLALPENHGAHDETGAEIVLEELAARGGTLVLGPGLGREPSAFAFARTLTERATSALVLDADGLNAHVGDPERLARRSAPTVLTPHDGELARLLGVTSAEVAERRLHHVRLAAQRSAAIVVLKGDDTLIAQPDGMVAVSPGASPCLATAGTGDVLSGVLGALLARGEEPFTAACAAVRLHARAAAVAADRVGVDGVIARDVVDALPAARRPGR